MPKGRLYGWLGNIFLVVGMWQTGQLWPHAFAVTLIGELFWAVRGWKSRDWDVLAISLVFAVIAFKNWLDWISNSGV